MHHAATGTPAHRWEGAGRPRGSVVDGRWAIDRINHHREVIEATLADDSRTKVEAACARSDLFERQRRLMDESSEYVTRDGR